MQSKKLMIGRKNYMRSLPANVEPESAAHFESNLSYQCPDLFLYHFRSISLLAEGTLFRWTGPLKISFPFFKKRLPTQSLRSILSLKIKWKKHRLEKERKPYLLISDQWTKNYYHWITQALPRLILAKKNHVDFILLLPHDHISEFHTASLQLLEVANWITLSAAGNYYVAENLIFPSHDIQIGDYSDDLIRELAGKFHNEVTSEGVYVFVHRQSKETRRIVNEDAVINSFRSFGFLIVEFENITFAEQRRLAGSATILAGIHGAGLTNSIFMKSGSSVFELTTRLEGDQYYYFTLSNALGHKYYYQLCDSDDDAGKTVQERNVLIDVEKLNKNIRRIIADRHD